MAKNYGNILLETKVGIAVTILPSIVVVMQPYDFGGRRMTFSLSLVKKTIAIAAHSMGLDPTKSPPPYPCNK